MSKTLLIYERAVPVNKERHGSCGVKVGDDFSFAKDVNSMPLLAQEFREAIREYPIVFAGSEASILPAVLLGFSEHENLFVDDAGKWDSSYIPAFARRYPYVFSSSNDGQTLTLCIDEEASGFNQEGDGERLFSDDGEQTPYLKKVLKFQTEFQRFFKRTQDFCENLQKLKLLDPMKAHLKLGSGQEVSIGGFMIVNRERLKAIPAETLAKLVAVDELELIYLHLQSMRNVTDLGRRIKSGTRQSGIAASGGLKMDTKTEVVKKKKPAANKKKPAARQKKPVANNKKPAASKKKSAVKKKKPVANTKTTRGSSGNGKYKE